MPDFFAFDCSYFICYKEKILLTLGGKMSHSKDEHFGKVIIIVGMQYGSEGKGAITTYLSPLASLGVRTGASNAGHTIYFRGQKFVMRQIPSVWVNPLAKLIIGRGAIISLDVLFGEIEYISRFAKIDNRLYIDPQAHVVTPEQIANEKKTDLAKRIGSTSAIAGEGIGIALADKVLRKSSCLLAREVAMLKPYLSDTVDMINSYLDDDEFVILEGTQGFNLSLEHGSFPYVTSRDTTATAIAASAGVSTHLFETEVIGVTRTYPIRVAGQSGPSDKDSCEITWQKLTKLAGAKKLIVEKTSVTGKVRRVATFSEKEFKKACQVNRPKELALTFADYLDWTMREKEKISPVVEKFMERLEELSGVEVTLVKTGPKAICDFDWYRRSMLRKMKE